jgi:hypothetical protein
MSVRCQRCGKNSHPTWRSAVRAVLASCKTYGCAYRIYRCPAGTGYHLTTQPKRETATA